MTMRETPTYHPGPRRLRPAGTRSSALGPATAARREMMLVSKAYYFDHKSKVQIADELGISRFKVARLLTEAEEVGVVSITLNSGSTLPELSDAVCSHLGIQSATVIEVYGDVANVRTAVGRATGAYLRDVIEEGEVLGIGWGRTLNAMIDDLDHLPKVQIVQLSGRYAADTRNSAGDLVRRTLALTGGGSAHAFPAPFFIDDARTANALRRQPQVAAMVAEFNRITTAVLTVGVIGPRPITVAYSAVPSRFTEQVMRSGGVAEVCGIAFAEDGHPVDPRLWRHCMTITPGQLRRIPRVVAAASDPAKAAAVRAVCSSGLVTELVLDVELANALLALPPITEIPRGGRS